MCRGSKQTMKPIIIVLVSLQILCAQKMNQKMILSAELATEDAAQSLYEAEKLFQENDQARELKKTYKLSIGMELLEPYVLVTIKPITTQNVKNKLHYLLQSKFPQNFMVNNTKRVVHKKHTYQKVLAEQAPRETKRNTKIVQKTPPLAPQRKQINTSKNQEKKDTLLAGIEQYWRTLDSEWWGLIFLALAGFLLVYRSAKQMSKIKSLQEEVSKYQTKIEGEMNNMGETRA